MLSFIEVSWLIIYAIGIMLNTLILYKKRLYRMSDISYLMSEGRLTERDIAEIVKMRGLGYGQAEIAHHLGVSQSAVQYQLAKINKRARQEGNDDVFLALLVGTGLGIGAILLLAKLFEKK